MTRPRRGAITAWDARIGVVRHLTGTDERTATALVRRLTSDVLSAASTDIINQRWPAGATPGDAAAWLAELAVAIQG